MVFQDIGKSYHQRHDYQKDTASHRRCPLFVFMELREYFWFFSSDRRFADSFSEFKFFEKIDVDRIEDPRDEKCDQSEHDDII